MADLKVGDVVHGFCGGYFGRDSFRCRRVEALGRDWLVTRNESGTVEFATLTSHVAAHAGERDWCSADCDGPTIDPSWIEERS
jgi:hypothetical protein